MANRDTVTAAWDPVQASLLSGGRAWQTLKGNRLGLIAGLMILAIAATALLVPLLPLQDPISPDYDRVLEDPGSSHLLGTDLHGRDQLSRVLWASRTSLLIGVMATGTAVAVGLAVGGIAGYSGHIADSIFMRTADVFLSFPVVLGAIAIMAVFGPGRRNVFLAIAFFGWPVFARVFRSSVLSIRERGFVKAARLLGSGEIRIFLVHILPNSIGPLVSYAAMAVAGAILAEAGLSFINLGVQRPHPSWGLMLSESIGLFEQAPWLAIVPGAAVTLTALAFILLGAAATRALEPSTSKPVENGGK